MSQDNDINPEAPGARVSEARGGQALLRETACGGQGEFSARTCYGVTGSGPNAVIARAWRGAWGRVRHAVVTPADAAAWRQWLLDAARPGAAVAGCVMVRESLTLWLQAPFASISKAEKVLPSLLDVQLPFPLESCYYHFVDIRRTLDGATRALAVAARIENLQARLDACRAQGWDPILLDHEGLALWTQSREEHPLPPEARRIILHADLDHVTLVIGQGDRYGNAHSVQISLPAEGLEVQAVLAGLVGRLQRILRAEIQDTAELHPSTPESPAASPGEGRPSWLRRVSQEYPAPQSGELHWLASGVGARNGPLVNGLHRALAGEWPGPLTVHREPEAFLARALGTRALARGPLRCNLRVRELAHPALLGQIRARKMTTAALFLAAGLLLCGVNLAWRLLAERREAGLRQAVATLAAELAPGVKMPYGQEVREVKKVADQRADRERPFLDAFEPSLAGTLAELIRAGKAQGVAYETLALRRSGFALAGTSDDWDQCERLAAGLQKPGYTVKLERQEAVADAQVRFSIKGEKTTAGETHP